MAFIVVERRYVVDSGSVKLNTLGALRPVDILLDAHLTIDSEAGWAGPSADELNDLIWAVRSMQRASQAYAY